MTTLALSKRGSLTLPPALRRKMGLDNTAQPAEDRRESRSGLEKAARAPRALRPGESGAR